MQQRTYYAFIVFIFIRTITSYAYFTHYYPSNFPTKHGPIYEKSQPTMHADNWTSWNIQGAATGTIHLIGKRSSKALGALLLGRSFFRQTTSSSRRRERKEELGRLRVYTYIYTYIYTRRSSGRPALFPSNRAEDWASDWVTYNPDRISLMIGHETPTHGSPPPSSGGGGGGREGWDLKIEALPYDRDVISTGRSRTLILLIVDTPPCVYTCAWLSSMGTYVPFVHASTYVRTGIRY